MPCRWWRRAQLSSSEHGASCRHANVSWLWNFVTWTWSHRRPVLILPNLIFELVVSDHVPPHVTFSPRTASPSYRYVFVLFTIQTNTVLSSRSDTPLSGQSWEMISTCGLDIFSVGNIFLINLSKSQLYFKIEVQIYVPRDVIWRLRAVKIWGLNVVGKGSDVLSYPILSSLPPKIISSHNLLSTFLLSPSLFYFMPNPLLSSSIVTANTDTPIGIDGQNDWRSQSNFLLAKAYRLQSAAPNKNVGAPLRGAAISTQLNANTAFCTATHRNNYELCVYIYYVSHT